MRERIESAGIHVLPFQYFTRRSVALRNLLATSRNLRILLRSRPHDVVVNVSIFVVMVGTIAALLSGSRRVVNFMTGMGYVFLSDTLRARVFRFVVKAALRVFAHIPRIAMAVQNQGDLDLLKKLGFVAGKSLFLVRGSGIDTKYFQPVTDPLEEGIVTFIGRMLESKGVLELIEAARILCGRGEAWRIAFVGTPDSGNPQSVRPEILEGAEAEGAIEYWG